MGADEWYKTASVPQAPIFQFWTTMRIEISPIVRAVLIAVAALFIIVGIHRALFGQGNMTATGITPKLTDAQKLEITRAQVAVYQAKEVLESTPQFKAFQNAQNNLNETALRIQRESKVDPTKFSLGQDLEFVAVPQPEKK